MIEIPDWVSQTLRLTGYCPFCGRELSVMSVSVSGNIIWSKCLSLCEGAHTTIESDPDGFIIEPYRMRPRYMYTRPIKAGSRGVIMR